MIIWNKSSEIWRRHEFRVSKSCHNLYRKFVVLGLREMSIHKNSILNEFLRYQHANKFLVTFRLSSRTIYHIEATRALRGISNGLPCLRPLLFQILSWFNWNNSVNFKSSKSKRSRRPHTNVISWFPLWKGHMNIKQSKRLKFIEKKRRLFS